MNKKLIILITLLFLSSCTIWDYEFKKIETKKEVEKISNTKILEEVEKLKEEMAEIRRLKEKELKMKEKEEKKKDKKLTKDELEMKLLEVENKKLEVENKKIDIDTENKQKANVLKKGEFCLLDTCLYKKDISVEWLGKVNDILVWKDFFISFVWDNSCKEAQILKNNWKCKIASKMWKNKTFLEKILISWKKTEKIFINNFLEFYTKNLVTIENKKINFIQDIFDKDWIKQEKENANKIFTKKYNLLSQNMKIWLIDYTIHTNFEKIDGIFTEKNTLFLNDKEYVDSKIISLKITNLSLNEKYLYKNYIFLVDKEKQIYVLYSSEDSQSERILNLWIDAKWLKENISDSWDFLDKELSEKIVWYYWVNWKKALYNGKDKRIFSISGEDFPIFKVKKFDNKWHYLLILKDWFYTK